MYEAPILSIRSLSVYFKLHGIETKVVDDVGFNLKRGRCLGLVGESGSGKSISSLAIMQLLPEGAYLDKKTSIVIDVDKSLESDVPSVDLLTLSLRAMRKVRGKRIAMIFQDAMTAFNPVLTIGQQIGEVLKLHAWGKRKDRFIRAKNLLNDVGINEVGRVLKSYPHELSGGMRQRAMIAMALACDPEILIADEPCTALDVTIQAQVIDLLLRLKNTKKIALLFISHDLAAVKKIADDIVVMKEGVVVEKAVAEKFYKSPQHEYSKALLAAIPSMMPRKKGDDSLKKILAVKNLKQYFPIKKGLFKRAVSYVKAVDGIDLECLRGQTLALVGESGSGKTTAAKTIIKLLKKTGGGIKFQGNTKRDMQMIFQDPSAALNPRMMVLDIVLEGLRARKYKAEPEEQIKKAKSLLEMVSIAPESIWRYPHQFSGGQRQRICIARALALEPKLLILDEPTSALDVSVQMQVLDLLESLQTRLGLTYLLITHNLGVVAHMAHWTAVMYHGKIVEYGKTQDILQHPQEDYTKALLAAVPKLDV
jgi:peptide/nickel transport system ATP-binding protein